MAESEIFEGFMRVVREAILDLVKFDTKFASLVPILGISDHNSRLDSFLKNELKV